MAVSAGRGGTGLPQAMADGGNGGFGVLAWLKNSLFVEAFRDSHLRGIGTD